MRIHYLCLRSIQNSGTQQTFMTFSCFSSKQEQVLPGCPHRVLIKLRVVRSVFIEKHPTNGLGCCFRACLLILLTNVAFLLLSYDCAMTHNCLLHLWMRGSEGSALIMLVLHLCLLWDIFCFVLGAAQATESSQGSEQQGMGSLNLLCDFTEVTYPL